MYRDPRCALSQEQTLLDQLRALATDDPDFFSDLIEGETNLLELIGGLDASIVDDETLIDGVLLIEDPLNLQARRSDRSDNFYVHLAQSGGLLKLLQHLLPRRRLVEPFETVANHDDRAAVVCALTALCVAAGDYSRRRGWLDRAAASLTHTALAWVRLSKNAAGTLPEEHIANINTSAKDPRVAESMS